MKLTVTGKYDSLSKGTAHLLTWRVYMREVTVLNTALTGTWTEITDRIDWNSFPSIKTRIEYEVGQFTSDSLELTGLGLVYWKDEVFFLLAATEYLEIKVEFTLGTATDTLYMFAGFVDPETVEYDEVADTATFTVFTADDLGGRIAAEAVSTQFVNPDIDGAGTDGLVLQGISGLYFKSANVASYVLKVGTHKIYYQDVGDKQAKLDNGAWVTLAVGTNTLGNGETAADDTERVQVYVASLGSLPSGTSAEDDVVVITAGTVLPNQWYRNVQVQYLLSELYSEIGIDTVTFDTMEMPTFDAAKRVLFLDTPPADVTASGVRNAIATDGTNLFMAVGAKIYKRTMTTGVYTYMAEITGVSRIERMKYNARNDHLWIYYDGGSNARMRRLTVATSSLSAEVTLGSGAGDTSDFGWEIVDYNYSGSSYKYGVLYTNEATGKLRFLDSATLTVSDVTVTIPGGHNIVDRFVFQRITSAYRYKVFNGVDDDYFEVTIDGTGNWVDGGEVLSNVVAYSRCIYNSVNSRIYYQIESGTKPIKSHALASATETQHYAGDSGFTYAFHVDAAGLTWFTNENDEQLYSVSGTSAAVLVDSGVSVEKGGLTSIGDRLFGMNIVGAADEYQLWQCDDALTFIVRYAQFGGTSIRDSISKILRAFNLISTISFAKKAFVYRRGDSSGAWLSTGNIMDTLDGSHISDVSRIDRFTPKVKMVKISGETKSTTYDGTNYDVLVLSDKRVLEINNGFIPDEMIKDVAKIVYKFFNTQHDKMVLKVVCPFFQYEPFDECAYNLTDYKTNLTGTSLITSVTYTKDGSMELEVFI